MTAPSLIKKTLKIIILALFLYDRFIVYKDIKAKESFFNKDLHHTVLKGFDVNLNSLKETFKSHQIFKIPFVQRIVEKGLNWYTSMFNINQTYTHEGHSHPLNDFTHNFKNRLIALETNFKFYFITVYNLLMMALLYKLFTKDSIIGNSVLLFDTALKLISSIITHGTEHRLKFFDYIIYTFSKNSKGFQKIWHEVKDFLDREKVLIINIALFSFLFILLLYIISEKMSEKMDLSKVAKVASSAKQAIETKLHQMGVGSFPEKENIPMNKSPERVSRTPDQQISSPDYPNMKTEESEVNLPNFKSDFNFNKGIQKEMEENIRSREISHEQNKKSKSRSITPSKRRLQQPTL
jgi:hypothetical protein